MLDDHGATAAVYRKMHLVPFGEYVPFRDLLGLFLRSVARGIAPLDVSPGARVRSVRIAPEGGDGFAIGAIVCFELLFPDLVRRFPLDGGELLVGITNDAWYGRTGAPYQFLAITALRSAETGLWTARAANTGVSAFVEPTGSVGPMLPLMERGVLVRRIPLRSRTTLYTRLGDWLVYAAAVLGAAAAGIAHFRRSSASC